MAGRVGLDGKGFDVEAEPRYIRIDRGETAKIKTAGLNFGCKVAKIKLGGLKMGK